jgi:O-antigen ligase
VTAEQFASAPLVGVGPGRLDLVYVDYLGRLVAAEYTHDEFLQTAAETGVVGAGLAVAAFGSLGVAAYRRRHAAGGPFAAAVLAAFATHSTFDFLWHIPVLPLVVVAAAVPLLDQPSQPVEEEVTR